MCPVDADPRGSGEDVVGAATDPQHAPAAGPTDADTSGQDPSTFVNAAELSLDANTGGRGAGGVDWEHADRAPSGSSIIDANSVTDDSGRSYHGYKAGKYFLPNDAAEQDRLDLQHAAVTLLLDGNLVMAPVQNPKNVIDIATGTGIWALEFAEQHPESQVIGTDLSAIQPERKLANCSFVQDDAEEEWLFGSTDNPIQFDYVHLRMVVTCFDHPRKVMQNAYKNMKPGGWIEYVDCVMNMGTADNNHEGTALKQWYNEVTAGLATRGRDLNIPQHYQSMLREEGFVDVLEQKFMLPCNPWPENPRLKETGRFMMTDVYVGLRGVGWKALKLRGYSPSEIEELIANAKSDVTNSKYRWCIPCYVVYGRKPFESETKASLTS